MKIDLDSAKLEFRRLAAENMGSDQFLELVLRLREDADLTPEDRGWVLWNICDRYAVRRDAATQHKYQSEFFELVRNSLPERAHWVVCDGTQALTLVHGGFGDFWFGCYRFANETAPRTAENRTARFESHRANAGFRELHGAPLEAMAKLLEEDPQWANQQFAYVTYMTQLAEFYASTDKPERMEETAEALVRELDDWLGRVGDVQPVRPEDRPLFGSWQAINADRPPSAVFIGVHNAACAFAKIGLFPVAERLFRIRWEWGRMPTAYGEALFLLSCWQNRHDKGEIVVLLDQCTRVSPESLKEFAPEVAEIVRP